MSETSVPTRPAEIIVTDSEPLIHLARHDRLDRLYLMGQRVVMPDMALVSVREQAPRREARIINQWITDQRYRNGAQAVRVEPTSVGRAFKLARKASTGFQWPEASDLAIVEWLPVQFSRIREPTLFLYSSNKARALGRFASPSHAFRTASAYVEMTATPELCESQLAGVSRTRQTNPDTRYVRGLPIPAWDTPGWELTMMLPPDICAELDKMVDELGEDADPEALYNQIIGNARPPTTH
ncbi:hypothetical protein AA12717_0513 [Gluconacetobacter sacchari DSM 12717]|uniref:Uncharacterized protein n=2 Tax=Gluconacetobacter sacchari TaxID=92759 RepID=A0A7W4IGT2_9PROT|nr:hypothetical protein [Gluconacetobacter sacchari]MBB2162532.1 hypothetical protein [Gluconacetobacter sacchari]GBQ20257.1 hypothetical protein AA12717_0513 [Gluconacetobacter sacchari DSM 12717]